MIGIIWHALAVAVMVAMYLGWSLPTIVGVEIFTAGALWFAYLRSWPSVVEMTAMVWMAVAMGIGAHHGHHHATPTPTWVHTISFTFAAALLACALWFAKRRVFWHIVMPVAMALSLVTMS